MPKIDFQTVGYRLHPVTCLDDKIFHKTLGEVLETDKCTFTQFYNGKCQKVTNNDQISQDFLF